MLTLSLLISISYLITSTILLKRIPESISETSYIWENSKLNPFSFYCMFLIISLFFPLMSLGKYIYICFISLIGVLLAGSTPMFKESKLHYIGGILAVFGILLWIMLNGYWLILLESLIAIIVLVILYKKSWVFWIETILITALYLILIF